MLFILGGLASLAVAARLWTRNDRFAWGLGALAGFIGALAWHTRAAGLSAGDRRALA
ncbi:MAG TPA: hypothetical protein VFZ00_29495 [Solirubrobacter sp.]|nr:hypothetical protein [Solirubrobacter sp.]